MPVVRNPQFNFREGFCWNNVLNPNARLLKVKLKQATVNDVGSMSLMTLYSYLTNAYFVSILNTNLLFDYYREFINCTVNIQINDLRQIPVVIPDTPQKESVEELFQTIYEYKQRGSSDSFTLSELERKMDEIVEAIYNL